MWMRPPTPVTMHSMSRLSGSIRTPIRISRSPTVSQLSAVLLKAAGKNSTSRLSTNEIATAPIDNFALRSRSRWVNNVMAVAAASGRNRMMKGIAFMRSVLHRREVLDVRGLALAVKGDDEGEADGHFGRRHGDD